jgi:hypothetical protein
MDDKTFITEFAIGETKRINEALKDMVNAKLPPSEETKNAVLTDIENTLQRLQNLLTHIDTTIRKEDEKDVRHS